MLVHFCFIIKLRQLFEMLIIVLDWDRKQEVVSHSNLILSFLKIDFDSDFTTFVILTNRDLKI